MKELHRITEIIKGIPNTAVITDGRFSGASGGLSIGYLCLRQQREVQLPWLRMGTG